MSTDAAVLERTVIYDKLAEIHELCRRYNVQRLDLFGSALRDDFTPDRSDLDFLVVYGPQTPEAHYENFFGLWFALEDLFGRSIDIVEPQTVKNPYVAQSIYATMVNVYEAT